MVKSTLHSRIALWGTLNVFEKKSTQEDLIRLDITIYHKLSTQESHFDHILTNSTSKKII